MKPWKAILAAAIIFVAGGLSGVMGSYLYRARDDSRPQPVVPDGPRMPSTSQRMDFMRRLGQKLELTAEQQERIDTLLLESQERMRQIWETVAPNARDEMQGLHQKIEAELTPEQKALYDELLKSRPPRGRWDREHRGPRRDFPGGPEGRPEGRRPSRGELSPEDRNAEPPAGDQPGSSPSQPDVPAPAPLPPDRP